MTWEMWFIAGGVWLTSTGVVWAMVRAGALEDEKVGRS